ncbi:MAG: ferredoxin [Planctomycetota bacterium]|nr:MAG: ferredoxin [Planctomycetota bacterium]
MSISRVWIEEGCTGCGLCEETCPDVFKVDDVSVVVEGADFSKYEELIKEAAENCPVEVIKYE